jgi:hypothetical protein
MKKLVLLRLIPLAAFLMISCPQTVVENPNEVIAKSYTGLKSGTFWAQNLATDKYYQVDSVLLAEGEKCLVWAERSAWVPIATGEKIALSYDDGIYNKIVGAFGSDDIMTSGDVDKNGKLTLLLLDIKDGYNSSGAYTAGYFFSSDLLSSNIFKESNERDMIYVDTYPSTLLSKESYATIAHELQHFINFTTRYTDEYNYSLMDTWIDEGLSAAAEYIYLDGHSKERVADFTLSETVQQGNNFFVWGNRQDGLLDDYATVYLFFQWLRIQSGETDIYRRIIDSPHSNFRAVAGAITGTFAEELGSTDWETILRSWLAANYINSREGLYGYRGELPELRVYALGGATQELLPGEGVYSKIASASPLPSAGGPNIKYAGLRKATGSQELPADLLLSLINTLYPNGMLLTFNSSNDNNKWTKETGYLSGAKGEDIPQFPSAGSGRSARQDAWQDSWRIDARDILGRPDR